MKTNEPQKRLQPVRGAQRAALARQILQYEAWSQVRQFAYDLFDKRQVHYVALSLDHREGRSQTSVEWVTAYDSAWRPLTYDFTRPFWKRKFPDDSVTILEYLDSSIREMIGQSNIGVRERNALRQELANDLFDGDRSFFKGLPTNGEDYDLTRRPSSLPAIFVSRAPHAQNGRKTKQHPRQAVVLVYRGISKPSRAVQEQIAREMKAPIKACIQLRGWLYNRQALVPALEKYPQIAFAVCPVDAYIQQWGRLSRWLPGRLKKRVRAIFHIREVKEAQREGSRQTIETSEWFL
jgi:hypothetical protein